MPKTQAKRGMSPRELDALRKRYVAEQKQADSASKWKLANDIVSGINDIVGRGVIAPILGMPGDINQAIYDAGAWVNNKIKDVEVATGMVKQPRYVQPSKGNAYLGSEDIGSRMEQEGLVSSERRPLTEFTASMISPSAVAKTAINAPNTARNMLRMIDNLEAPQSRWVRLSDGRLVPRNQLGAIHNIFHGTTPDAAKAIERDGFDLAKSADGSIWFTSNPNIGEVAASGSGGIVRRTLDDEKLKLGGWGEADKYGVDELLSQGYDGLMLDDGGDVIYQVFNPSKLGQPVTAPQPGLLGKMVAPQDK